MAGNEKEQLSGSNLPLLPRVSGAAYFRWFYNWEKSSGNLGEFLSPTLEVLMDEQPALTKFLFRELGDDDEGEYELMGGAFVYSLLKTEEDIRGSSIRIPIVSTDMIRSRVYGIVQSNEIPYEQRGKVVKEQIERENSLLAQALVKVLKDLILDDTMTPDEASDITSSAWITYDLLRQQAESDRLSTSFPELTI